MAMTKKSKQNISVADKIVIEEMEAGSWCISVWLDGNVSWVPHFYKSKEGARRAVLRLNPVAPLSVRFLDVV